MRRLSLISNGADRELDAIRSRVERFESVGSADDAIAVMETHAQRRSRAEVIDLIGHSHDGLLVLGAWVVDDSSHTQRVMRDGLRSALHAIGVHTIRLLGCATAATERGRAAMRAVELASGRRVHGTRCHVGKRDYEPAGFAGDHALVDRNGPLPARPDPVGLLASTATAVTLRSLELGAGPEVRDHSFVSLDASIVDELLGFVDGERSWVLASFVAEPIAVMRWRRANALHRLDVLCDFHLVRVYGAAMDDCHGRLFRVHDAAAFSESLAAATRPRI